MINGKNGNTISWVEKSGGGGGKKIEDKSWCLACKGLVRDVLSMLDFATLN